MLPFFLVIFLVIFARLRAIFVEDCDVDKCSTWIIGINFEDWKM